MARALAIDYGEKRVGLAVSDPLRLIANPLDTLTPDTLVAFLERYVPHEGVDTIILGNPMTLDGRPSALSDKVDKVAQIIRDKFPAVSVRLLDERFTSVIAAKTLVQAGYKKSVRRKKENLDKVSATILLQNFLDSAS
jgi:putative Holliday junction resolvase